MPYIDKHRRDALNRWDNPRTSGELNYAITKILLRYIKTKGLSYEVINDIKGALISAKDEFSRRIADPYEDRKILEHGDVYPSLVELLP